MEDGRIVSKTWRINTSIVVRFEQFLFEFVFVLETSQTIHGLKVDKINLRPDLVAKKQI